MATKGITEKIAADRGLTVEQLLKTEIEHAGTIKGAATRLGVSTATINWWIHKLQLEVTARVRRRKSIYQILDEDPDDSEA